MYYTTEIYDPEEGLNITQVSEVKIQYSMPSVQVGLVMPFCDCQQ